MERKHMRTTSRIKIPNFSICQLRTVIAVTGLSVRNHFRTILIWCWPCYKSTWQRSVIDKRLHLQLARLQKRIRQVPQNERSHSCRPSESGNKWGSWAELKSYLILSVGLFVRFVVVVAMVCVCVCSKRQMSR